ncbi:fluoride efflux transporter CrcB [Luteibaculum oceani]|uniref:Fluoride-specific ion channel FluC n=1 Tax=Luteibaculum oceani TaxID=1294296 RepID=A0A5C6UYS3_9FLAO|nr:fluoride efflux transporter CrcB [Luteibaculum oceani]
MGLVPSLLVFLGGGLGAFFRFGIGRMIGSTQFPWATLISNLIACLVLGVLIYLGQGNKNNQLLLVTGFCGGLSTFSTFSFETFEMLRIGNYTWAILNIVISVLCCMLILFFVFQVTAKNG